MRSINDKTNVKGEIETCNVQTKRTMHT